MLKEIVILSIMLCPAAENNTCVADEQIVESVRKNHAFVTAVTPWQKLEEKTIYFDKNNEQQKR